MSAFLEEQPGHVKAMMAASVLMALFAAARLIFHHGPSTPPVPVGQKVVQAAAAEIPAAEQKAQAAPAAEALPTDTGTESEAAADDTASWGRNPFRELSAKELARLEAEKGGADQIELSGILIRGDKRTALINRKFVSEGQAIDGYQVSRIDDDKVVLTKENKETVLKLKNR